MFIGCDGGCGNCDINEPSIIMGLVIEKTRNPVITLWSSLRSSKNELPRLVAASN
jgi:hypothetical protein